MEEIIFNNIKFYKIKDFDRYYISKCGKILSNNYNKTRKIKLMSPQNRLGYYSIRLYKNKNSRYYQVHRLVAETFISNPKNKPQVNHKNSIRNDNRIENLEWVSNSENQKHAYKFGHQKVNKTNLGKFGKLNTNSKKIQQFDLNGNFIRNWNCMKDVERELNILVSCISCCCSGRSKTAGGFIWKTL
jgi:hypothetical protein